MLFKKSIKQVIATYRLLVVSEMFKAIASLVHMRKWVLKSISMALVAMVLLSKNINSSLMHFVALSIGLSLIACTGLFLIYLQAPVNDPTVQQVLATTLFKVFILLLAITGVVSGLCILAHVRKGAALQELDSKKAVLDRIKGAHAETSLALKEAKETAESSNEAKSRYLAALSHELRTPLNLVLGYAQLLMRDPILSTQQRANISIIKRNGQHLADLIEGLLEISQIEAGRITLQRDEFNLKSILKHLVEMFQLQANKKGIKFNYIVSSNVPDYVATDKQRFRQILMNLISNAIKYTDQGSVTFEVTYRGGVAHFSIIDTGIGIAKSDQALILKPFEQIRYSHTQAAGGTGLGLPISYSLAELMGGDISLTSSIGKGSIFNFRLMLFDLYKDPKGPELNKSKVIGYIGRTLTILVIDDDYHQRSLMLDLLKPIGFDVLLANGAQEGFDQLEKSNVDLVLMDVRMSGMNGWQMVKILRAQHYVMPVLMVSANARDAEYDLHSEGYHNDYIAKPIDLEGLLGKISQLMSLQWQYQSLAPIDGDVAVTIQKPSVTKEHYQALIDLAEIGFLSGFKEKFIEIEGSYSYPKDSESKINEYIEVCDFPKIIEYLGELEHEA